MTVTIQDTLRAASASQSAWRKCVATLAKLHAADEAGFASQLWKTVLPVFAVKRGNREADRVFDFLGVYIDHLNEKNEAAAALFVQAWIAKIRKGFLAKSVTVRYRTCRLMDVLLARLNDIDDDIFEDVKKGLIMRMNDKDTNVRIQAGICLSKLLGPADDCDEEILACLLHSLATDPMSSVRKSIVLNIEIHDRTLEAILVRSRDVDKAVRQRVFVELGKVDLGSIQPAEREALIASGLGDRENAVREKTVDFIKHGWWDRCEGDVVEFIKCIDVLHSSSKFADDCLIVIMGESDVTVDKVLPLFDEVSWVPLTPEVAFGARVAVMEMGKKFGDLEDSLPTLSNHVHLISKHCDLFFEAPTEEDELAQEFIVRQLLLLAQVRDYSDELGRKGFLELAERMLRSGSLPPDFIPIILKTVRVILAINDEYLRYIALVACDIMAASEDDPAPTMRSTVRETLPILHSLGIIRSAFELITNVKTSSFLKGVAVEHLGRFVENFYGNVLQLQQITLKIIEAFMVFYFHPDTVTNQRLRQCLGYFLPLFAKSAGNCPLIAKAFVPAFTKLFHINDEEGPLEVSLLDAGRHMLEWTDYRHAIDPSEAPPENIHNDMAFKLLEQIVAEPDMGRVAVGLLNHLDVDNAFLDRGDNIETLTERVRHLLTGDAVAVRGYKKFMEKVNGESAAAGKKSSAEEDL
ncbi:hypothetical protein HK101_003273 [Irineochytrium annulatum]|nr:hypothetical protein HK101_003273 [Irineochytrium annulatum]